MRILVTGATGFIGTAVVGALTSAGHGVVGLARSDAAANSLIASGAEACRGSLADDESLRRAASEVDGVIHLAFIHGFSGMTLAQRAWVLAGGLPRSILSRFMAVSIGAERRAIDAIGSALCGSGRPFVATFGTMGLAHAGDAATASAVEADAPDPLSPGAGRAELEGAVAAWASRGVRASVVRLAPTVHGEGDRGFVPQLVRIARSKRQSAFIDDGRQRWPAVHRLDAANLFLRAVEDGVAGASYHGVAEEGVRFGEVAEVIGRKLGVPVVTKSAHQAGSHFGWLSRFVATDNPTSSRHTQERLGWHPTQPGLIDDLERLTYFKM